MSLLTTLVLVTCPTSLVAAAACDNANYLSMIGSIHTYHWSVFAAPDSQGNLLVAGNYRDRGVTSEFYIPYAYLFKQSDCSYVWTYQGGSDFMDHIRGVAWSPDEKKAFILAYPKKH